MDEEITPTALSANDQLDPVVRAAYEAWYAAATFETMGHEWTWAAWQAATMIERARAALVCDDEARIRTEAGNRHPDDSDSRGRCFSAARAAINCAKGVRGGEFVGPNARLSG